MADKKLPEKTSKGVSDPIPAGQGRARPTTRRAAAISPEDRADRTKTKPEDAYSDIVSDEPGLPHVGPIERHFVSARPSALPPDSPAKKFKGRRHAGTGDVPHGLKGHTSTAQLVERTRKEVAKAHQLIGAAEQGYTIGIETLDRVLASDESINSVKLQADARQALQRSLEQMDDAKRKQTIAALMAYIGQLQTTGALEGVPAGRLARVVSLVGEAAALVSTPASADLRKALIENADALPPLFADRTADLQGKLPTALQWFEMHWRPLIVEGCSGDDIRKHDIKYYSALASAMKRSGRKLSDVLPPSPTRGRRGDTAEDRQTHLRNLNTARVRRFRASRRPPVWDKEQGEALEWFRLHWQPRIEKDGLFSDDLKRLDPKLYNALASAQTRIGSSLGDLIPLRRKRLRDMKPDELEARRSHIRIQGTEAKRRQRSKAAPS